MPAVAPSKRTVEDYLTFDAEAAEGVRYEFWDGRLIKMAGAEPEHNQLKDNIARELGVRLTDRGCRVTTSDQRVRFGPRACVYPDVVVACTPEYADDERPRTLLNPEVIVEVTSPSTAGRDHGDKLAVYTQAESVKEYWIAEPDRALLTQFVRPPAEEGEAGEWRLRVYADLEDTVRSAHFDLSVPLQNVYALVLAAGA